MAERITSYDIPQWIKDKINSAASDDEIRAFQASVKSPNQCATGDPDLQIWVACQSVLYPVKPRREPAGIDVMDVLGAFDD